MPSQTGILQEMKALPKSPPAEQEPNPKVWFLLLAFRSLVGGRGE